MDDLSAVGHGLQRLGLASNNMAAEKPLGVNQHFAVLSRAVHGPRSLPQCVVMLVRLSAVCWKHFGPTKKRTCRQYRPPK